MKNKWKRNEIIKMRETQMKLKVLKKRGHTKKSSTKTLGDKSRD